MPDGDLQTASGGARRQLRLLLSAAAPDRADRVDDVPRPEVAAGSNDRVADGTTSDASALLGNPRPALGVNGASSARALVSEPPIPAALWDKAPADAQAAWGTRAGCGRPPTAPA